MHLSPGAVVAQMSSN